MLISLTLRIFGEHLDPDEITTELVVQPTLARRKGDINKVALKKEIVQKSGVWAWRSEVGNSLDEHIRDLNATFSPAFSRFPGLNNVERAFIDVCIVESERGSSDTTAFLPMDSESIAILHRLGLPLEFSFYGPSED